MCFSPGVFGTYRTLSQIHIGKHRLNLHPNAVFDYDGYTIRYDGGEYDVPQLASKIGVFFVPAEDTTSRYRPVSTQIVKTKATPTSEIAFERETVTEEDATVNTVAESAAIREAAAKGDQESVTKIRKEASQRHEAYRNAAPVKLDGRSEIEQLKIADETNRRTIERLKASLDAQPKSSPESMGGTRAASGRLESQDYSDVPKTYKFSNTAQVGSDIVESGNLRPLDVTRVAARQEVQQGRLEIIDNRKAVPRTGVVDAEDLTTRYAGEPEVYPSGYDDSGDDDLSQTFPEASVAGRVRKPAPKLSEEDELREVIEGWSTKRHWMKRVEEAVEYYGDWPEAIDAICSVESEKVAAQIRAKVENG